MADPLLLDPKVEELLRNVAADPRSGLLRVPRPARLGAVLERRPLVGVATAGLSVAERELVVVHRAALARSLRELARIRLFESPLSDVCRTRTNTGRRGEFNETRGEWMRQSHGLVGRRGQLDEPSGPLELLERCLESPDAVDSTNVTALVAAANVLEPTDQARIFAAQSLAEKGECAEAERVLHEVIHGPCSSANHAAASANLGWIALQVNRPSDACKWYADAARTRPDVGPASLGWLWAAIEAGDDAETFEAAAFVGSRLAPESAFQREFVELTRAQLRSGRLVGSAERRVRWRRLAERADSSVGWLASTLAGMV